MPSHSKPPTETQLQLRIRGRGEACAGIRFATANAHTKLFHARISRCGLSAYKGIARLRSRRKIIRV